MCHLKQIILLLQIQTTSKETNMDFNAGLSHLSSEWTIGTEAFSFLYLVFWNSIALWLVHWAVFLIWRRPLIGPFSCLSDLTAAFDWSYELSFWPDSGLWLVHWPVFLTWQLPLIGPLSCLSDLTAASDWSLKQSFWPDWGLIGPLHFLFNLTAASDWSIEMSFWSDRPLCLVVIIFMKIVW